MDKYINHFPSKEKVENLAKTNPPTPQEYKTIDVIMSNGFISVIKKEDGTYAIRNESTGHEEGCYLREEDAIGFYNDLISEK